MPLGQGMCGLVCLQSLASFGKTLLSSSKHHHFGKRPLRCFTEHSDGKTTGPHYLANCMYGEVLLNFYVERLSNDLTPKRWT